MPAIYIINWINNNYFYVGQTINLAIRRAEHRRKLRNGTHPNPKLQAVFNKWGDFQFHIIEECDKEELDEREQFYLDLLFNDPNCTNICPTASAPNRGRKLGPWSTERKLSVSKKMTGRKHSEASKQKMRKPKSEEQKQKQRERMIGRKLSEEHKQKLREALQGSACHFYGKPCSEQTKQKLREVNSKSVQQWTLEGQLIKTHSSITEAGKAVGVTKQAIVRCLSGKSKSSAGFVWTYSL